MLKFRVKKNCSCKEFKMVSKLKEIRRIGSVRLRNCQVLALDLTEHRFLPEQYIAGGDCEFF